MTCIRTLLPLSLLYCCHLLGTAKGKAGVSRVITIVFDTSMIQMNIINFSKEREQSSERKHFRVGDAPRDIVCVQISVTAQ